MADTPVSAPNTPAPGCAGSFSPSHVLAWSETLADGEAPPAPLLALWLPGGVTVVVGLAQTPEREMDVEACARDGVPLVRRHSGGGAVLLYPGVLCWEAVAPIATLVNDDGKPADIRQTYKLLCAPVVEGLARMGVTAFHAGISDLSVVLPSDGSARKIAGTAQLRRRHNALVHGSLLVEADVSLLERYLRFPSAQPEYRRGRGHADFCVALSSLSPRAADPGAGLVCSVAAAISGAAVDAGWDVVEPPAVLGPGAEARRLDKYVRNEWNWHKRHSSG